MYTLLTGLYKEFFQQQEYCILILGLDNAGKTTLLEKMKSIFDNPSHVLPPERITPTVGLNIGRFSCKSRRLLVWDLGGQKQLRTIWQKYYAQTHGVIFVVDAAEPSRFEDAKETLELIVTTPALAEVPILFLANKQDRLGAVSASELVRTLGIESITNRRACKAIDLCALTGAGVREGVDWLVEYLKTFARHMNYRNS